ncbi:hypothetical protein HDV00_000699 [Rhizophlyctis rosea]|nr:hypothetical protein HDV00_000699 [Rhizophlyctis rosea]
MLTNGVLDHVATPLAVVSLAVQTAFALGLAISAGIFSRLVPMPEEPPAYSPSETLHIDFKDPLTVKDDPTVPPADHITPRRSMTATIRSSQQASIISREVLKGNIGWHSYKWVLDPDFIAFLFAMAALGTAFTVCSSFAWLYTSTVLNASNTMLGLVGVFDILIELPFFFGSKQMFSYLGKRMAILVAGMGMTVRSLAYTFLTERTAWWVLAVEMLHGFSFSSMWVAAVNYANDVAPVGMKSTAQGLITGMYQGLGPGIGGVVGGVLARKFGYHIMFRSASGFTAVTIILYAAVAFRSSLRKSRAGNDLVDQVVVDDVGREPV